MENDTENETKNEEEELCFEIREKRKEGKYIKNTITFVLSPLQVHGWKERCFSTNLKKA